jgi:hypothetical protein
MYFTELRSTDILKTNPQNQSCLMSQVPSGPVAGWESGLQRHAKTPVSLNRTAGTKTNRTSPITLLVLSEKNLRNFPIQQRKDGEVARTSFGKIEKTSIPACRSIGATALEGCYEVLVGVKLKSNL